MAGKTKKLPPVYPGEILKEEFLEPMGLSNYALAHELGIPQTRVGDIVNGKRAITAETAVLLADRFGNTAEFWLGLQMAFDLDIERDKLSIARYVEDSDTTKARAAIAYARREKNVRSKARKSA